MDRSSWAPSDGFRPQQAPGRPGPNGATAAAPIALGRRGASHHESAEAGAVPVKMAAWGADSGTALDDAIGRFGSMTLGGPVVGSSSLVEHRHHQQVAADARQLQPHRLQHAGSVDGLDMGSLRVVDEVSGDGTLRHHQTKEAEGVCIIFYVRVFPLMMRIILFLFAHIFSKVFQGQTVQ